QEVSMSQKMPLNLLAFYCLFIARCFGDIPNPPYNPSKMYFAAAADENYYVMLRHCLLSLTQSNGHKIGHVAVFDLGLTEKHKDDLNALPYIHVYDIEPVNPYVFVPFTIRDTGKSARGWYSWKPAILKKVLEMYPVVLYIDASTEIYRPLDL